MGPGRRGVERRVRKAWFRELFQLDALGVFGVGAVHRIRKVKKPDCERFRSSYFSKERMESARRM